MEEECLVDRIASLIGSPAPAVRLIISLLLGYPIAFIHRKYLYGKPPNFQHLYFIGCGMSLCYFNYGGDLIHSFISISVTYLILKIFGGNLFTLLFVFTVTMAHLLVGYWTTATTSYDIKWTMPHCVLTLRLIGLAFNVYDGQQSLDKLSVENKQVALPTMPSALEVFAHSYFPGSFLVGPQLPLKRYRDFVELNLEKKANRYELPKSVRPGLECLGLGLLYLLLYQLGNFYVYDDYFLEPDFGLQPVWKKYFFLGLWSRCTLYKYISCWKITEGSCTIMGLTYNGVDEKGVAKWDGCSNVNLRVFETTSRMNHYIESFNVNTNQWVAQYIYKRLKFLNNKTWSHIGVLLFLAVWHGFHSGYYATFFFEFIIITAEKNVVTLLNTQKSIVDLVTKPGISMLVYVILRIYTFAIMGYAMIPFILLKYNRYMPVFKELYFSVHIICLFILACTPFLAKKLSSSRSDRNSSSSSSQRPRKIEVKLKTK